MFGTLHSMFLCFPCGVHFYTLNLECVGCEGVSFLFRLLEETSEWVRELEVLLWLCVYEFWSMGWISICFRRIVIVVRGVYIRSKMGRNFMKLRPNGHGRRRKGTHEEEASVLTNPSSLFSPPLSDIAPLNPQRPFPFAFSNFKNHICTPKIA